MANTTVNEIDLPWNGDFSIAPNGDWLLAQDTSTGAGTATTFTATNQRLVRLLLTTPVTLDQFSNVIAPPDDIFHPTWGSGLRAAVSGSFTQQTLNALKALIIDGITSDPAVATDPPPVISFIQSPDTSGVLINISFTTIAGQVVALPTLALSPDGV